MHNVSLAVLVNGIAAVIQIFFGFLYYVDHLKSGWSLYKRTALGFSLLAAFLCISGWITRTKTLVDRNATFVDKNDLLLPLREITDSALKKDDPDTAVKVATFALRFHPHDEDILRKRARAFKRLGPQYYKDEIRDREQVVLENPDRQENHLPIIEDYILLKEYDNAESWMQHHASAITDHDVKLMFEFFGVVCQVLKGEEYSSTVANFERHVKQTPLSKNFVEKFWISKYLIDFVNQNPLPESSKKTIRDLDDLLRQTAR